MYAAIAPRLCLRLEVSRTRALCSIGGQGWVGVTASIAGIWVSHCFSRCVDEPDQGATTWNLQEALAAQSRYAGRAANSSGRSLADWARETLKRECAVEVQSRRPFL